MFVLVLLRGRSERGDVHVAERRAPVVKRLADDGGAKVVCSGPVPTDFGACPHANPHANRGLSPREPGPVPTDFLSRENRRCRSFCLLSLLFLLFFVAENPTLDS